MSDEAGKNRINGKFGKIPVSRNIYKKPEESQHDVKQSANN
jgi:hypothetical protein